MLLLHRTYGGKKFLATDNIYSGSKVKDEYREFLEAATNTEDFVNSAKQDFDMLLKAVIENNGHIVKSDDMPYLIPEPFNLMLSGPWQKEQEKDKKKVEGDGIKATKKKTTTKDGKKYVWSMVSTKCLVIPGNVSEYDEDVLLDTVCNEFCEKGAKYQVELPASGGLDGEAVTYMVDVEAPGQEGGTKRKYGIQLEATFFNGGLACKSLVKQAKKLECYQDDFDDYDWDECEMWYYTIGARFFFRDEDEDDDDGDWVDASL
jgi:hypothetical protein